MLKILLLAVAVWLLLSIVKRYRNSLEQPSKPAALSEDMVQCAACNVHLPKSDSIVVNNQHYCSEAHSKQSS